MHCKQSVSNTNHFKVKVGLNRSHHTGTLTLYIHSVMIIEKVVTTSISIVTLIKLSRLNPRTSVVCMIHFIFIVIDMRPGLKQKGLKC